MASLHASRRRRAPELLALLCVIIVLSLPNLASSQASQNLQWQPSSIGSDRAADSTANGTDRSCSANLFSCRNGTACIPQSWLCDGTSDCPGGEDEQACNLRYCKGWQLFKCRSSDQCISSAFLCDGERDCADGSDERVDSCPRSSNVAPNTSSAWLGSCTRNEYRCNPAGTRKELLCIPLARVCNLVRDCPLGDDEDTCRVTCTGVGVPGANALRRCSFGCRVPSDFVPRCYCLRGYATTPEQPATCTDVDECAPDWKYRYCQHQCVNTVGSYNCSCYDGYRMRTGSYDDYGKCQLVDTYPAALFLLTTPVVTQSGQRQDLAQLKFEPFGKGRVLSFSNLTGGDPVASRRLDLDYANRSVCTLLKSGTQKLLRCYSTMVPGSSYTIRIAFPTEYVQFFAKEWMSGNWYFSDEYRGLIFVCTGDGTACASLSYALPTRPRELVVDPLAGYIFYADWGEGVERIERLTLDGSRSFRLVTTNIRRPQSLALDHISQMLYWFDPHSTFRETVDGVRYDGTGHTAYPLLLREGEQLVAISFFNGSLVAASASKSSRGMTTLTAVKALSVGTAFDAQNARMSVNVSADVAHLLVFHVSRQPTAGATKPCAVRNGQCSQLCLAVSESRRRCACMDGYVPAGGFNITCLRISETDPVLLYALPSRRLIRSLRLGPLHSSRVVEPAEPPIGTAEYAKPLLMSYDYVDDTVYYVDDTRRQIGRAFRNGSSPEVARYEDGSLDGIAVDWRARNLFWINSRRREIRVARLSKLYSTCVIWKSPEKTFELKSLTVDPTKGKVYWVKYTPVNPGGMASIWTVNMDGSNAQLLTSSSLNWPSGLSIDVQRQVLYFADSYVDKLYELDLASPVVKEVSTRQSIWQPFGTAFSGDMLYWSSFKNGTIGVYNMSSNASWVVSVDATPVFDLAVIDYALYYNISAFAHPCENSMCSDLCVPSYNESSKVLMQACLCADGRTLLSNGTCTGPVNYTTQSSCASGLICAGWQCLRGERTCDGLMDCADFTVMNGKYSYSCGSFKCPVDTYQCKGTYKCLDFEYRCDGVKHCDEGDDEATEWCDLSLIPGGCASDSSFSCDSANRSCIPRKWVCDGHTDCIGGTDEQLCFTNSTVGSCDGISSWRCASGRCIELERLCNGDNDCGDGSDERNCTQCDFPSIACRPTRRCLSRSLVCDSVRDCEDGSDEEGCTVVPPCQPPLFKCNNSMCIVEKWKCDGEDDCGDASDEVNCGTVTCSEFDFRCTSENKCISSAWRCDGDKDCANNEDEAGCTPLCTSQQYLCNNTNTGGVNAPSSLLSDFSSSSGSSLVLRSSSAQPQPVCLPVETLCDGTADCAQPPDETALCRLTSACSSRPCSHTCIVSPSGGFRCSCPPGYRLQSNNRTCEHVDACQQWGRCSQNCSVASRIKCSCFADYALELDGFTCSPKEQRSVSLIFSNRHELRMIGVSGPNSESSLLTSSLRNTIALDYHYEKRYVFWTDVIDDRIYRGTQNDTTLVDIRPVVESGLPTAEGLAVDWIGNHIYWVESTLDVIDVADLDGQNRSTLIAGAMQSPRAIALDPRFGFVFWSDWGMKTIERANMTGEGRRVIFNVTRIPGAGWPNGLTLDYDLMRVYWIDARSDSVHTVTYDGYDVRAILLNHNKMQHAFAITVFGNYMYWTDWRTNTINKALKWNGSNVEEVQVVLTQPFDVKVYHPLRQPLLLSSAGSNPCSVNNGNCSHLCLLAGVGRRKCACPHMMTLRQDGLGCTSLDELLVFAWQHEIRGVLPSSPSYSVMPSLHAPLVDDVVALDHFYESETEVGRLIFWIGGGSVNAARFGGQKATVVADGGARAVAVDWSSSNVYIASNETSTEFGLVQVSRLDGSHRLTLVRSLRQPAALALDPQSGTMFIYDEQERELSCWLMNGTRISNVGTGSSRVIGLTADPFSRILYWCNGTHLLRLNISGGCPSAGGPFPQSVGEFITGSLTVSRSYLYYFTEGKLYFRNLAAAAGSQSPTAPLPDKVLLTLSQQMSTMKIFSRRPALGACRTSSCSERQLCLPTSPASHQCVCPDGFEKSMDGSSCQSGDAYLFIAGSKSLRAYGLSTGDNLASIPQANAVAVDYWSDQDFVYWMDSSSKSINRIRRDLTNRAVVVDGIGGGEDITVDWIAGNLYWTDNSSRTIEVSRLNGSNRYVIIHENLTTSLHSIAVHPSAGFLFFTNDDALERANLDGSSRTVMVKRSQLSAVAVDTAANLVYFCNLRDNSIERIPIDRTPFSSTVTLVQRNVTGCRSLHVHNNTLYWADSTTGKTFKAVVPRNGYLSNVTSVGIVLTQPDIISDVIVYNKHRQLVASGTSPCQQNNGGCQGLCFYNSISRTVACKCTFGQLNQTDQKSCVAYKDFLAFSTVKSIQFIPPDSSQGVNKPWPDIGGDGQMKNVIGLAVDYVGSRLFISDIQAGDIKSVFFNGTIERVLAKRVGSAEGLAYEPILRELYFTRAIEPSINRLSVDAVSQSFYALLNLSKEDRPRSIVINACGGHVYWTNWHAERPAVQRAGLDGFWKEDIINTSISIPNGLAIDHGAQKLYWADAKIDKIERCNLDGTDRVVLTLQPSNHVFSMALYKDFIFWTDWQERAVMRANKFDGSGIMAVVKNIQRQPMGIVTIEEDANKCNLNPCQQLMFNGSAVCEHECVVERSAAVCKCLEGYVLVNGTRCVENSCPEDAFKCPSLGGDCIPFVNTCDGVPHCVIVADGEKRLVIDEDPAWCRTRQCPSNGAYFRCTNNRCVMRHRRCDGANDCGDLSDEVGCTCSLNMSSCRNGECIRSSLICNGFRDCRDGTDELGCPSCEVRCLDDTRVCISQVHLCDGIEQCPGGWDESTANCDRRECHASEFRCTSFGQCIQASWRCDGDPDCADGSDEYNCVEACDANNEFPCNDSKSTCLPHAQRCDGVHDCTDGSDEQKCPPPPVGPAVLCDNATHFHCPSERCVPLDFLCDGEDDCPGGADERPDGGCPAIVCPVDQVACSSRAAGPRRCIDASFMCDGFNDCGDNSDEFGCPGHAVACNDLVEFRCASGGCVPIAARCDGVSDCGDGSDERPPTCPLPPPSTLVCNGNSSLWACPDGTCILRTSLCDGRIDCRGGSTAADDELSCGINECLEMNGGCTHFCTDEVVGYSCSCRQGFRLSVDDSRTCEDVDECATAILPPTSVRAGSITAAQQVSTSFGRNGSVLTLSPCSQYCRNTIGSYFCTCADGYRLASDKRSCKADGAVMVLVANRFYVRSFTPTSSGQFSRLLATNLSNAVGIDYDYQDQKLYWSDIGSSGSSISVMTINGTSRQVLHHFGLKSPDGIAVDWVGRNLYWCDTAVNSIEVSKLNGRFRKMLLSQGLHQPRALQVHPYRGLLFYADWGRGAHIGRMNMDGTEVKKIVQENLGWPNALAIDTITDTVYFGDAKKDYIGSCDLSGQGLRAVPIEFGRLHHIFGLTVFENHLYWTDWENMTVSRVDASSGANFTTLSRLVHRPMGIVAYHAVKQSLPKKFVNPCDDNGGCNALCLLRPVPVVATDGNGKSATDGRGGVVAGAAVTRVCACPDNHVLVNDSSCISMCTLSQYTCSSTLRCIPFYAVCDGRDDCGDGSDELACDGVPCRSNFSCNDPESNASDGTDKPECITPEQICNRVVDCSNGRDEQVFGNCANYTCPIQTMSCKIENGSFCLPLSKKCDGKEDCLDKADEDCEGMIMCNSNQFRCGNGQCIALTFRCDTDRDCADGSDESADTCSSPCPVGYLRCVESGRCIPDSWRCDGDADCKPIMRNGSIVIDNSDERDCANATCRATEFACANGRCIPGTWRCDGDDDCRDNSDEDQQSCAQRPCSESEYRCKSDGKCIRSVLRCNGDADCRDGSDEINCTRSCQATEFQCTTTGRCIPFTWRCDDTPDCPDKSDEWSCNRTCPASKLQCANSLCLPLSYHCDGADDCGDGSDEQRCNETVCQPDRFHCANNKCIMKDLLCNGKDDCGDRSDESHCRRRETCSKDEFQCLTGRCIPAVKICNGQRDCPGDDVSDERGANMYCLRYIGGCSAFNSECWRPRSNGALCTLTNNTSVINITCMHIEGFTVDDNSPCICKDVDECLEYGRCSQRCHNLAGGYECVCEDGFVKEFIPEGKRTWPSQGQTCIAQGPPATLLLADSNHLKAIGVDANSSLLPALSSHRFDAVDVYLGPDQWLAFLVDYHTGAIMSVNIDFLNRLKSPSRGGSTSSESRSRRETKNVPVISTRQSPVLGPTAASPVVDGIARTAPSIVVSGLSEPRGVTVDWINQHVYWTDAGTDRVEMSDFYGRKTRTISASSLQEPHAIAVEPVYRKMLFWTDWGKLPRIWSSQLDGAELRALPLVVHQPTGLTVDGANDRLYWTDTKKRTIETSRLDGSDQRVIRNFESPEDIPYMIDIFEDYLYVSMQRSVYRLNKFSSVEMTGTNKTVASGLMRLGDFVVVQTSKQLFTNVTTPCLPVSPCGHQALCTVKPDGNYSCNCPTGWKLDDVGLGCLHDCPLCQNGGICTFDHPGVAAGSSGDAGRQPQCLCPAGFTGPLCELYPCKDYCKAGGLCELSRNNPVCLCPPGYTGTRCEFSLCSLKQCQNGGTCNIEAGLGTPFCLCPVGFGGPTCAEKLSQPLCSNLCKNNGTCQDDSVSCKCLPGFVGYFCEKCQVSPTSPPVSCASGGVCSYDSRGEPVCQCEQPHLDWRTQCRTSVCSNWCQNGATCHVSESGHPVCTCHSELFSGTLCQYRHSCVAGYCQNGGVCLATGSGRYPVDCDCPSDFVGVWCETKCNVSCPSENMRCDVDATGQHRCICKPGLMGKDCNVSVQCLRACFNGGQCLNCDSSASPAVCTECSCTAQFTGQRCETRVQPPLPWSLDGGKIAAIVLVLLGVIACVIAVIGCYLYKRHQRIKQFLHLPLNEPDEPLTVVNPLYELPWTVSSHSVDNAQDVLDDEYYDANPFGNADFNFKLPGQREGSEERQLLIKDNDSDEFNGNR